jgi:hypothetical protein
VNSSPPFRATSADAELVGRLLFDFNTEFAAPGPDAVELGRRFGRLLQRDARRFYERHGFVNIELGTDYRMLCYLREL